MVFLVLMNLETLLGMSFVVEHHHFAVRIFVGIPTFHVTLLIRDFMSLLGVFVIARGESKFVAVWPVNALIVC